MGTIYEIQSPWFSMPDCALKQEINEKIGSFDDVFQMHVTVTGEGPSTELVVVTLAWQCLGDMDNYKSKIFPTTRNMVAELFGQSFVDQVQVGHAAHEAYLFTPNTKVELTAEEREAMAKDDS